MLGNISSPESQMLIEACASLDKLRRSYTGLLSLSETELEKFYGSNRVVLGRLAMIAGKLLSKSKSANAEQAIMLLYKPLTGQIEISKSDFVKIERLLDELESEHFFCDCI